MIGIGIICKLTFDSGEQMMLNDCKYEVKGKSKYFVQRLLYD